MLAMVRNWNFPVPLSLPIHMTEGGLATRDLHLAIQRAVLSNRFWNKPYMNSTLFKQTPLAFQRDFPGSRLLSTVYFDNPGLVILLLNDGDTGQGGKYITLYQVSPPEKLAVWDSGEGEVCSESGDPSLGSFFLFFLSSRLRLGLSMGRYGEPVQAARDCCKYQTPRLAQLVGRVDLMSLILTFRIQGNKEFSRSFGNRSRTLFRRERITCLSIYGQMLLARCIYKRGDF